MAIVALTMLMGLVLASAFDLSDYLPEEGSDGSEKYSGTDQDEYFNARSGNDLVLGRAGDDTLLGGPGSDWLVGSDGADLLNGGSGDDVLLGGAGKDTLAGGNGNDFIETANIFDTPRLDASLESASSFQEIAFEYQLPNTSDEGDHIEAGSGNDTIVLGANDTLISGSGEDEISTGDWITGNQAVDIMDFDSEEDILFYTYEKNLGVPLIEITRHDDDDLTQVRANGVLIANLHDSQGFITPDHVILRPY